MVFTVATPVVTDAFQAESSQDNAGSSRGGTLEVRTSDSGAEAQNSGSHQLSSIKQVLQKAREVTALKSSQQTVAVSEASAEHGLVSTQQATARREAQSSPTALDMELLRPSRPVQAVELHPANIDNPQLLAQQPSYGNSYSSIFDRTSTKGNPLVWTMSVVYGGLTVLVILLYIVWTDGQHRKKTEKPKSEMRMSAGYSDYVL